MRRIRRLIALFVLLIMALVPLSALADATPIASPQAGCAFPPVPVETLREIRSSIVDSPPPTPTPEPHFGSPITHLMPFPPPPGQPVDGDTITSIRRFLDSYVDCLATGEYLAIYGAWTDDCVRRQIGSRVEFVDALIQTADQHISFPYPRDWKPLVLRAWSISTGHVVVIVQFMPDDVQQTMLLVPHDDSWRIDDIWGLGLEEVGDNLTGPIYATPIPNS